MEKTKKKRQSYWAYIKERCTKDIPFAVLMGLYAAFCIGSLIYFAVLGGEHVRDCFIAISYIIVIPVFFFAEYSLRIRSPYPYTVFVLVYCVFCFLGASYNFYTIIPVLDDILHACWGILFASLGLSLAKSLLGEPKTLKQFIAYLVFSAGFCMLIAIAWEIYEFTCDRLLSNFDMQEDTIIYGFNSFMLHDPYDHLHTLQIGDITKTVITYGDGQELVLDGYLDIGLMDTMMDIIWCVATTAVLCAVLSVDRAFGSKLNPHIIPVYVGDKNTGPDGQSQAAEEACAAEAEGGNACDNPAREEESAEESQGENTSQNAEESAESGDFDGGGDK